MDLIYGYYTGTILGPVNDVYLLWDLKFIKKDNEHELNLIFLSAFVLEHQQDWQKMSGDTTRNKLGLR